MIARLRPLLFIAAALIFSLGIFSFTDVHSVSAIPGNDNFASAIVINPAALPYSISLDDSGATTEGGEATIACSKPTEGSMWWSFTPTVSGSYQIDTFGSADDTVLAVYTGSAVNALTTVDCKTTPLALTLLGSRWG